MSGAENSLKFTYFALHVFLHLKKFKSKIFPGTHYCFSNSCVSVSSSERVSVMAPQSSKLCPGLPDPCVSRLISHPCPPSCSVCCLLPPVWNSFGIKIYHIQEVFLTLRSFPGLPTPAQLVHTLLLHKRRVRDGLRAFPPHPVTWKGDLPWTFESLLLLTSPVRFLLSLYIATVVCLASRVQADSTTENISPWSNISDSKQIEKI